jgi:signal transduction histidine kinase
MYANLGVVDTQGRLTCSGSTSLSGSLVDRSYIQRARSSKGFAVGEYIVGRQTGKASLPFALPLLNSSGEVDRIVFATVDLETVSRDFAEADWPEEATVIVSDREHTILVKHPHGEPWIGRSLKGDPVTLQIGSRESGVLEHIEKENTDVFAFSRVQPLDSGVTVRVYVSKTQARAAATWAMYRNLLLFALVACVIMLGVQAASHRLLLHPIKELTRASRRLTAGDIGARVAATTTIPELHELAKDFDGMATALEEREKERLLAEMQRKQLEQHCHQAQKMDAVGRLAGGIAHDFNNMLTAILGYCELLLEDPKISSSHRNDIVEIEKAGKTAAQLTRQLLSFSRREIVKPAILDVNAIVSAVDKMLHRLVGEHIEMKALLALDVHAVKADRGQIEQVVLNLALNARDAIPEGGCISIKTENVHLSDGVVSPYLTAPPGDYVMLAVRDTGSGMPAEVLSHLWSRSLLRTVTAKGLASGSPRFTASSSKATAASWSKAKSDTAVLSKFTFRGATSGLPPMCLDASLPGRQMAKPQF